MPVAGQTYRERPPAARLAALVATTWVQRIPAGEPAYAQRHLPTGGVELRCRVGDVPRLAGTLTGPHVELLPPGTTVVGLRLRPGALAAILARPVADLTGHVIDAGEVWGTTMSVAAGERVAAATTDEAAVGALEALVAAAATKTGATAPEPLLAEAARRLLPWHAAEVRAVGADLFVSERGFRRHCLAGVGIGPKALQRVLRFQGFLAMTQAAASGADPSADGLARLAVDAGYADQAHLTRECVRLTGVTPRVFLRGVEETCACGHDHSASFQPLLREAELAGSFKNAARGAPSLAS